MGLLHSSNHLNILNITSNMSIVIYLSSYLSCFLTCFFLNIILSNQWNNHLTAFFDTQYISKNLGCVPNKEKKFTCVSPCLGMHAITCAYTSTCTNWFRQGKFATADRFYLSHTECLKQDEVLVIIPLLLPYYYSFSSPSIALTHFF